MSNKQKSSDLGKAVSDNMSYWYKRTGELRKVLKNADQSAVEHPALGIQHLLNDVATNRDILVSYLRDRFGYDVVSNSVVEPARFPDKAKEKSSFLAAFVEHAIQEIAFNVIHPIVMRAEESSDLDEDTYQKVRESYVLYLGKMPGILTSDFMLRRGIAEEPVYVDVLEECQVAWLSGWVGSQISLGHNKRLEYALKDMSSLPPSKTRKDFETPRGKLVRELPATTLIELGDFQRDESCLFGLVHRVTQHLEKGGNQLGSLQRRGKLVADESSDAPMEEPMLEEFLLKEEVHALRVSAKLSAREDQVFELMLKGRLDGEIAQELGVDEGSVKTTKFRMRQKLKQAAGR